MDTQAARVSVSHAQRLPHELLAEIFLLYQAVAAVHTYPPELPPPLLLGQICSIWRNVVHSTPRLWTIFPLMVRSLPRATMRTEIDHVSFAKAWVSRSRPHPLYVWLSIDASTVALSRILDGILPSADRLQDLRLRLPFMQFQPLAELPAGSMPLLESVDLAVDSFGYRQDQRVVRTITAFADAPRLRSITLRSSDMSSFGYDIQMPWSRLTMLNIDEEPISANKCRDAFLECTNLIDCTLTMDAWVGFIPEIRIVVLPKLHKLNITFFGPLTRRPGHSSPFFQPLSLPALKDLTVATFDCVWSHQIFMGFVLRSSMDLRRLCFKCVKIQSNELLEMLSHMKSLVELQLELCGGLSDPLLGALRYRGTDGPHLVPMLEKLHIFEILGGRTVTDDNNIADMIESRWWTDDVPRGVSRLQMVDVAFDRRKIDVKVKVRLERCRQEGLVLSLD